MRWSATLDIRHIPNVLADLIAIAGQAAWHRRIEDLENQAKTNPLFANFIELAMARAMKMRRLKNRWVPSINHAGDYQLFSLAATVSKIFPNLSELAKKRFAGNLRSALQCNNIGLAAISQELIAATHFVSRGFDVGFSDLETGGGFDFLASVDELEIEIECKHLSTDRGGPDRLNNNPRFISGF